MPNALDRKEAVWTHSSPSINAFRSLKVRALVGPLLSKNRQARCLGKQKKRAPPLARGRPFKPGETAQVFIDSKNSELFLVLRSLSSRKSIASMVPIGLRIRRSTYIF